MVLTKDTLYIILLKDVDRVHGFMCAFHSHSADHEYTSAISECRFAWHDTDKVLVLKCCNPVELWNSRCLAVHNYGASDCIIKYRVDLLDCFKVYLQLYYSVYLQFTRFFGFRVNKGFGEKVVLCLATLCVPANKIYMYICVLCWKKDIDQLSEKTQIFITNTTIKFSLPLTEVMPHSFTLTQSSITFRFSSPITIGDSATLLFDRLSFCPWSQSHRPHAPCCPMPETEPGTLQACHRLQFDGCNSWGLKQ